MPLPQPQTLKLIGIDLQGLNIERGVLVRPNNSFTRLENFDLVKPGVIRKAGGSVQLTSSPTTAGIVGFRDYQKSPSGPTILVVVDAEGELWSSAMSTPIALVPEGSLLSTPGTLEEAPFIVCLPFEEDDDFDLDFDKVQYVVITVGSLDYPKYWDGFNIYNLGIPNPGDGYTVDYQHSMVAPQRLYTNTVNGVMFKGTSPLSSDGIPIQAGRRYRASWYNPLTGHDSSLFPLSLAPKIIEDELSGYSLSISGRKTKPGGVVNTTPNAIWLMAQPLFLDNLPATAGFSVITAPQPGYTKIRIWATRDGLEDYFLVPVLYNKYGQPATDANGAIDYLGVGMQYGLTNINSTVNEVNATSPVWDGFVPIRYHVPGIDQFDGVNAWFKMVAYNDDSMYTVNAGGQTGNTLNVTLDSGVPLAAGVFRIAGDETLYYITGVSGAGPNYTFTLTDDLVISPADDAAITFFFIKPVADVDLVTPFAEVTGPNSDRQNDGPPKASWGAVYQNRLFLLNANDKTQLVYSRIGHYEDYPPDNVFRFTQSDYDPITALLAGRQVGLVSEGADQRLVVGKQRSTSQITGTSDVDFAISGTGQGLFAETGIVHKRAAIVIGGFLLALTRRGLELMEGQRPIFVGSVIKDIVDTILLEEYGPCFITDRRDNQILLAVQTFSDEDEPMVNDNTMILMREPRYNQDGSLASPFSTLILPQNVGSLQESGFGDDIRILAGCADGHIYQLLIGTTQADGSPVEAIAETQLLPQDDRESRKIFKRIQFEGNPVNESWLESDDIPYGGWKVQFDVDGTGEWTSSRTMYKETLIGLVGKTLRVRIIHDEEYTGDPPMLSNFMLEYVPIGEAR